MVFYLMFVSLAHASLPPQTLPIFLKFGFSTVLEFDETPSKIVLGDVKSFQVERLDKSLVIRALVEEGHTNLFVYFKEASPLTFTLSASDGASPTYYKKVDSQKLQPIEHAPKLTTEPSKVTVKNSRPTPMALKPNRNFRITKASFDEKKDFLTLDLTMSADSNSEISPIWEDVGIRFEKSLLKPKSLWAERKDAQRDTIVKVRLLFAKADLPRNLKGAILFFPTKENPKNLLPLSVRSTR